MQCHKVCTFSSDVDLAHRDIIFRYMSSKAMIIKLLTASLTLVDADP